MSHEPALAQHAPDPPEPLAPPSGARLRTGAQAVLVALSVYVAVESLGLRLWTSFGPGPGFFPFVLAIALGLLAIAWFVQSVRAGRDKTAGGEAAESEGTDVRHAAAVLGSLVVLAAVMDLLGYQISVFLFLMYHLKWRAGRSWVLSLALSLAGSAGIFYGFAHGLMVQLPPSGIPFLAGWGL
ncbi:tripartite tricarboxylate transporter TctB family protein [Nonomuraea sp. NPDC050643]|uniref:tripartite tricarboxylate transporter TctB family protein n=1 Tax=Nonomuraea sp. NPDC050643 TaxID=3155660 RepID=UPI0034114370